MRYRVETTAIKNESPQKAAMRQMMRDYLENNDVSIKTALLENRYMASFLEGQPMLQLCD